MDGLFIFLIYRQVFLLDLTGFLPRQRKNYTTFLVVVRTPPVVTSLIYLFIYYSNHAVRTGHSNSYSIYLPEFHFLPLNVRYNFQLELTPTVTMNSQNG